MQYEKIIKAMCGDVWLIHPDKLAAIVEVINIRLAGGGMSAADIEAAKKQAKENASFNVQAADGDFVGGDVAVITLYGTLAQRTTAFQSGGVSVERFGKHFDAAMADPSVGSIVLDIASPGGSVYGIEEISEKIYLARGNKKVVAVANSMAASGAYWIAAAADEVVVTPGGDVGSVGVWCLHQDQSGAYAKVGIKNTIIKAGKFKAEANSFEALSDEATDHMQQRCNEIYDVFTTSLAKFRGVGVAEVRENFGQGRIKGAKEAVASQMADAVGTLDSVIAELKKNKNKSFGARVVEDSQINNENSNLGVSKMPDQKITIDSFKADHGDIFSEIFEKGKAEGEKAERDMFAKVVNLCDGDNDLAVECFTKGISDVEVLQAKNAKLAKANEALGEDLKAAKANKPAAGNTAGDELAVHEFSDDASDEKNAGKKAEGDQSDDELKAAFAASKELKAEFGTDGVDAYVSYVKAERDGLIQGKKD